ncbi:hypothetical protein MNBD_ALPHA09-2146 [hydrothermal vent metagenome]|uniref:Xanthine and CO dehydrogenases maturation factor, XdhC/CoxF family n=1 Tax=hydrothermal vent metagenome TaxID=652676 RepID=A0A3B0TAQ7_9ZZZZ
MTDTHQDLLGVARDWLGEGRRVAIATVVQTWGSAPRSSGSLLVINAEGHFEGSVSGGCVEAAVVTEAGGVIAQGKPKLLEFGVADETAWEVGLACGGRIEVFVEPLMRADGLDRLIADARARVAVIRAVNLSTGEDRLIYPGASGETEAIAQAVAAAFRSDKCRTIETEAGPLFLDVRNPDLRLTVIGAVHIAQALAPIASLAGYQVRVIDPRGAFASPERFPGHDVTSDWPEEALAAAPPDGRTAFVALTHDPKIDDPALDIALRSECFYIGALGSKKTCRLRHERLTARGFSDADLARIHGPIGLDIGARGPAEIAIAIMAEITSALRQGSVAR